MISRGTAAALGRHLFAIGGAVLLVFVLSLPALAQKTEGPDTTADAPPQVRFSADQVSHDRDLGTVTASGSVEVQYEDRILLADTITYNQRTDVVTASGNLSLLEPTGEVIFAEYMEISGNLKDAVIRDFRMILQDGARVAAAGGKRERGRRTEMYKAVYSPCDLCPEDPDRPPLWQVKAAKVIHDQEQKTVEYRDAWLEMGGIPVAYTPYLSHPDPTAKRKSGFLTPSIGGSSDLGLMIRTPYFWNISPDMDATLTPMYVHKESPALAGEFRMLPDRGSFEARGSITETDDEGIRAHILSEGRFDIDPTWRWGFDVERATDDTYMRRYDFGSQSTLTSNAFIEGFRHRNYAAVNAYAFQGLDPDSDPGQTPLVLPMAEFSHVGRPDRLGGRTSLDMDLLSLTRTEGTDTRRLSALAGWQLPYISPLGGVYTLDASMQMDAYHVNSLARGTNQSDYDGLSGRVHPQLALKWRHPFVRQEGSGAVHQLLEPTVQAIVAPYGNNPDDIPNEDSRALEFDDTNLFTLNRFPGRDRVEGGPRVNYGLQWGVFGRGGGSTVVRVGQSYRVKADDTFRRGSGLSDNFSDVVGSLRVSPGNWVNGFYRTRVDKDDLSAHHHELQLSAGPQALSMHVNYLYTEPEQGSEFSPREQIRGGLNAQLTRYWRGSVSGLRDLVEDEMRQAGLSLTYEDECLVFETRATRTFYHDRDLKPTDAIVFTLSFKTLGDVSTGISRSQN